MKKPTREDMQKLEEVRTAPAQTLTEYRPCRVAVTSRPTWMRALFHRWVTKQGTLPTGGQYTMTVALVEFVDGSVETVNVEDIRFNDSPGLFEQFIWE